MSKVKIVGGILLLVAVIGGIFLVSNRDNLSSSTSNNNSPNVAIVNGQHITREDFEMRLAQISARFGESNELTDEQKEQVVTQMVSEELLLQDAANKGITVSDDEVNAQMDSFKTQFESSEKYQEALAADNLTEETLKSNVRKSMLLNKYVDQVIADRKIEVTDEEIQKSFEESTAGMENGPTLEEVREQVKEQVLQQKVAAVMQEIVDGLRTNADVQILL